MMWKQFFADFLRFLRGEPVPPLTASGNVNPDALAREIDKAPMPTAQRTVEPGTAGVQTTLAPPGVMADTVAENAATRAPVAVEIVKNPAWQDANDFIMNPALARLRQVARTQLYTTFPQLVAEPPKE